MRMPDGTYTEIVVLYQGQHGTSKTAYWNTVEAVSDLIARTEDGSVAQRVYRRVPKIYTRERYPELYPQREYCLRCAGRTGTCAVPPEVCPEYLARDA